MKKTKKLTGLMLNGSLRAAGVTFYTKQGRMVVRPSRSMEQRSCTRSQFVQRQRMRHSTALWHMLSKPLFTERSTAYLGFLALANRLPAVFIPKRDGSASLLMPGIPVSEGTLPPIRLRIGESGGVPALLTDLASSNIGAQERLFLYTAEQNMEGGVPRCRFMKVKEVKVADMVDVAGCLALTGDEYADPMRGWALVRVETSRNGDVLRCSTQSIVTRCTFWQQYTTDDALLEAARSYGGLTDED